MIANKKPLQGRGVRRKSQANLAESGSGPTRRPLRAAGMAYYSAGWRTLMVRLTPMGAAWLLTVAGVKRYWLTAARTLLSRSSPADLTIFTSVGLPVASTVIETSAVRSGPATVHSQSG